MPKSAKFELSDFDLLTLDWNRKRASLHGGSFASTVVPKEGRNLVLVQVECEFIEGQLSRLVHFGQAVYADP